MKFIILSVSIVIFTSAASHAEAISDCNEIKKSQGIVAFVKCVGNQNLTNFRPGIGPAHGMAIDEASKQETISYCKGMCEAGASAKQLGDCVCD